MIKLPAAQMAAGMAIIHSAAREDFSIFQEAVFSTISGAPYLETIHAQALSWALEKAAVHGVRRLLIAAPPRHFKSYLVSQALPAWLLGRDPTVKVVCASYGQELATQFAGQSRSILQSDRYKAIFPQTKLKSANPPVDNLATAAGGYRYTTSVGGVMTGIGANFIIIDDPLKADDAQSAKARESAYNWFKGTALTRLDKPNEGVVIVAMQRLHQDDLFGRLQGEGGWAVLELPARFDTQTTLTLSGGATHTFKAGEVLFPANFDVQSLANLQKELGEAAYSAQFLQKPVPAGGNMFKLAEFGRFDLNQFKSSKQFEAVLLSVDPAVSVSPTADYTAITRWGVRGRDLYLLDACRGHWSLEEQIEHVMAWEKAATRILIESSHSGIILKAQLNQKIDPKKLVACHPVLSKETRASYVTPHAHVGEVLLPIKAPWLAPFEDEIAAFPHGKNDDYVDAMSQLIIALRNDWSRQLLLTAWPLAKRKVTEAAKPKQMGDHW